MHTESEIRRITAPVAKALICLTLLLAIGLFHDNNACAQGSVFGPVTNPDMSIPADGEITFVGFLDDTDEEIRLESCDGAWYGTGNWFDDFQNFLTEAPGNPYDYLFFNNANGAGFHLQKLIPNNSYQQEDIPLGAVAWPDAPAGLKALSSSPSEFVIGWDKVAGLTYHIYRRVGVSNGSFFRMDNPAGLLTDPGIDDSVFSDITINGVNPYDYVIIAENTSGFLSPHSAILTVTPSTGCCEVMGDANRDGSEDISDLTYFIDFMFDGGPPPVCLAEFDNSPDCTLDISDLTTFIDYMFGGGSLPACHDCP